ncbi:MAG: hypothetical protein R2873_34545 [Caldilineaceae bacterium]
MGERENCERTFAYNAHDQLETAQVTGDGMTTEVQYAYDLDHYSGPNAH